MKFNEQENSYKDVIPYNCTICGMTENAKYFGNKQMVDNKLCFSCQFWTEHADPSILNQSIRIDGTHYMLGNAKEPGRWNGHGGRVFTIKMNDGRIIETFDLWYQGTIPLYFKDKIPDNAEFTKIPASIGQGFLA